MGGTDGDLYPLKAALAAEFLGTLLLIVLGDGVVGTVVLLGKEPGWLLITTGWGLAVALAVYVSGRISGGHINPAVTLALAVRRDFPWSRVVPYWAAQVAGAFTGALIVYTDYAAAFASFESQHGIQRGQLTAGLLDGPAAGGAAVFCTFPAFPHLGLNLFSEALGTLVLVMVVLALIDRRNLAPGSNLGPLLIGFAVWSIGLSLGGLTAYAINPARDFGPRVAAAVLGWGTGMFSSHGGYFWVPVVAPLVGGVAGAAAYDAFIGRFLRDP